MRLGRGRRARNMPQLQGKIRQRRAFFGRCSGVIFLPIIWNNMHIKRECAFMFIQFIWRLNKQGLKSVFSSVFRYYQKKRRKQIIISKNFRHKKEKIKSEKNVPEGEKMKNINNNEKVKVTNFEGRRMAILKFCPMGRRHFCDGTPNPSWGKRAPKKPCEYFVKGACREEHICANREYEASWEWY